MLLSFHRFYKLRIITAVIVFILAILYLTGYEEVGLAGFAVITALAAYVCNKLRLGTMAAYCDLCGRDGLMKAEYGAGFSNARLVLNCCNCGRVVNSTKLGVCLKKEK